MKRLISLVIIAMIVASLSGCGAITTAASKTTSTSAAVSEKLTTVTTDESSSTLSSSAVESYNSAIDDAIAMVDSATFPEPATEALTAEQVIAILKNAGLPITNVVVYDEKTDLNGKLGRPNEYTSKASFSDPAHKDNDKANPDNTVEVFATEADAKTRADYIESVTKGTAMAQYIYQASVYVLRVDYDILPTDAQKYEDAFKLAIS